MYDWDTAYASKILHDPVYTGNLTVVERKSSRKESGTTYWTRLTLHYKFIGALETLE